MSQYVLTDEADRDIREGYSYLEARNRQAAQRFTTECFRLFTQLAKYPGIGTSCEQLLPGLQRFPLKGFSYVVYYQGIDDGVRIIRVIHGARDVTRQFDEPS